MNAKKIERKTKWNSNESIDDKEVLPDTHCAQENLARNTDIVYADYRYAVSLNGSLIDEVNEES